MTVEKVHIRNSNLERNIAGHTFSSRLAELACTPSLFLLASNSYEPELVHHEIRRISSGSKQKTVSQRRPQDYWRSEIVNIGVESPENVSPAQ